MTTALLQGYQWATGFNNVPGLKAVEMDVPTFRGKPFYVHALGAWDPGVVRMRGDGTEGTYGFKRPTWLADVMGLAQYNYIQATYTPGGIGMSAKLTIRTRNGQDVFANFNAILYLPKKSELQRRWDAYRDAPLVFSIREAL